MRLEKRTPRKTSPRVARKRSVQRRGVGDVVVPDKLYFRIGEVARLCAVPAYVLRFWETEFPQLKPNKSGTGQRMYRKREVEHALHIKKLLYDEGFTISGARQHLKDEARPARAQSALPFGAIPPDGLKKMRHELQQVLRILSSKR
jgi:DNA-binding transcriptional MerR regulator